MYLQTCVKYFTSYQLSLEILLVISQIHRIIDIHRCKLQQFSTRREIMIFGIKTYPNEYNSLLLPFKVFQMKTRDLIVYLDTVLLDRIRTQLSYSILKSLICIKIPIYQFYIISVIRRMYIRINRCYELIFLPTKTHTQKYHQIVTTMHVHNDVVKLSKCRFLQQAYSDLSLTYISVLKLVTHLPSYQLY